MKNKEKGHTVLIFEDDIQLAHEWKQEFLKNGIHAEHTWDVDNAMSLCEQTIFDAIICDVFIKDEFGNLKSEAGVTLINRMRYQLRGAPLWCRKVPILVVTGSSSAFGFDILNIIKTMGTR